MGWGGEGVTHKDAKLPACSTSTSTHPGTKGSGKHREEDLVTEDECGEHRLGSGVVVTVLKQVMSVTRLCWASLTCHSAPPPITVAHLHMGPLLGACDDWAPTGRQAVWQGCLGAEGHWQRREGEGRDA